MIKKVCYIDLDGTIIDSEAVYQRFWKEALKECGYNLDLFDTLSLRSSDKINSKSLLQIAYGDDIDLDKINNLRHEKMDRYLLNHVFPLKENVEEGLKYLQGKKIKIYIVSQTSSDKINKILSYHQIDKYFDGILSARDCKRGKPYPDVYLKALELSSSTPDEAFCIEDSPNGIISAYKAGIDVYMLQDLTPPNEEISPIIKGLLHTFSDIKLFIK